MKFLTLLFAFFSIQLYPNNLKSWFLTASALPQNFHPHLLLASRQWSLVPDKNFGEPPCQIPHSSSHLGIQAAPSLIFVHLGGRLPASLYPVLRQARFFNQNAPIYLLTDSSGSALLDHALLSCEKIELVQTDLLHKTKEHRTFCELIQADPNLPNHYLIYTLERFFYLFDFIQERQLHDLFHLENDTLLYADLNELLPLFEKEGSRLATPFLSRVAAVPCFVYIKDSHSLASFINFTLSWAEKYEGINPYIGVSDMKCLAYFYRTYGKEALTVLPTLMAEYPYYYRKRSSMIGTDNRTQLDFLATNEELFSGRLFDAATFGVFANGNDREFFPESRSGAIHFRSLFDPRHFSLFWEKDSLDRPIPHVEFKGKKYAIVNLHLHSKLVEGFTSYNTNQSFFP